MRPSGCAELMVAAVLPGAALLAAMLSGCGDAFVDGTHTGLGLYDLAGVVRYDGDAALPDQDLGVTVLWSPEEATATQTATARITTSFPARYAMSIFTPPDLPDAEANGRPVFGAIVLYVDADGDGELGESEDLAGGSDDVLLLYAWDSLVSFDTGFAPLFDAGYHAVEWFDAACTIEELGPPRPAEPLDTDLTVSLDGYAPFADCGGR